MDSLSKFASAQNKTNYKKAYTHFDTIEQTRIARARKRQLVKTVLREGARLLFLTRCDVLLHPHGNQYVFAYNVPAGYYRVIMPKVTSHTRKRIACLHKEGFFPIQILKALRRENLQDRQQNTENWIHWKPPSIRKADKASSRCGSFYWKANKRRGNKCSDSKTSGQAWSRCELLRCAKIASQIGMDAAAHPLLSTDKSS